MSRITQTRPSGTSRAARVCTSSTLRVAVFALAAGCTSQKADDSGAPPLLQSGDDSAVTCEGTPPEIVDFTVENGGIQEHENESYPSLVIEVEVTDADADLETYALDVWYDDEIDGAVDTTSDSELSSSGTLSSTPCSTDGATLSLTLFLGGDLAFETLYEWAAVVTDANGLVSETALTEGYTPTSDGEDGGTDSVR
ncbi:MAG: hypothetical protein QGG40_01345 [Myxococcota bacterium]|jgi:hypothetical protein|nr:hypothetical protein [Myxococcota bacterium]